MGTYRVSRNLEATLVQYIEESLTEGGWSNVEVVKGFKLVYDSKIGGNNNSAIISVRLNTTSHKRVEVGSNSTKRKALILIDIFAANDGQRLDLKDFLVDELKGGCIYYEYIVGAAVNNKTANGRIRVLEMEDMPIDFGTDKSAMDPHDRFRHLITIEATTGKVEE